MLPRSFGTLRQWHWISSAVCLIGMLLFAITGITLNHAASIPADPTVTSIEGQVPSQILDALEVAEPTAPLPQVLIDWLASELSLHLGPKMAEWSDEEVYLALPRPGGDAWLSIDLTSGELIYELTERGWISYFNDLHKGRNTGGAWSWFIDVFSVACIVFCITGLWLLIRHAQHRPMTWPVVGLGFIIPLLVIVLFVH